MSRTWNGLDLDAELFPENKCLEVFAELSVWTSVEDCLAAARVIEGRLCPEDSPSSALSLPCLDDKAFKFVLARGLEWLGRSFCVPASKVKLASLLEPAVAPETWEALLAARFSPQPGAAREKFMVVRDASYIITLVRNPIRCFARMLSDAWSQARALRKSAAPYTDGIPRVFHQPYTDGPLPALIEAMVYSVNGFDQHDSRGLYIGYRSIDVVDRPPVDRRLFEFAQEATEEMFRSLK